MPWNGLRSQAYRHHGGETVPRWLILLIAVLVVLVIAILMVEHVNVGVH